MDALVSATSRAAESLGLGQEIGRVAVGYAADLIATEVDCLSLGTNDLTQYTLAVDRLNERVADLYQPTHPAVLRLIEMTVTAARKAGIRVCICGEMASDIELTPLLIGLGLNELSVASGQVARLKHAIRKLNATECQALAADIMQLGSAPEILAKSRTLALLKYPELFA